MRPLKLSVIALLALFAGACASTAEQRLADEARCRDYGFRRGTDAFAKCLQDIDLDRSATRRADLARPWGPSWYGGRYRYWW